MATDTPQGAKPHKNETLQAILIAAAISVVLASIMVGSPFHALRMAYFDYSRPTADTAATNPPAPQK